MCPPVSIVTRSSGHESSTDGHRSGCTRGTPGALLRRGAPRETVLRVSDLEVDTVRRTVRRAGVSLSLKPKEYALLEFLMRYADRPVTKSLIIEHVWDIHFDSISNVVEVHINSLRHKVDRGFARPLIHTVRGVGYVLSDTPP
jgi:two-component system, OmpR family, response regulator